MKLIQGKTFAEVYKASLSDLITHGYENFARGTSSREFLDVALVIEDPYSCLYENLVRGSKFKYIAGELLWYYSGRNDIQFISKYSNFWKEIQNPDETANSAYGNLIFSTKNEFGFSEYEWAISSLITDKHTRQAVFHFNNKSHQYLNNKDFVCTMYGNFHIRQDTLYLSIFMRSNDAIWGTPTDVAFFCTLLIHTYKLLLKHYPTLKLGSYTHVSNSYHIYDRHYDLVNRMLNAPFIPVKIPDIIRFLINDDGKPTSDLISTIDDIVNNRIDKLQIDALANSDILSWIKTQHIDILT